MNVSSSMPLHIARAYGAAVPPRPAPPPSSPLVSGTVSRPVEFDTTTGPTAQDAIGLYARAADRVEVAVAVQVGRTIDVRG